ncbi:GyrI-like domain-containing protein [Paenibacillus pini]|uniref:Transcriptional regulator n=1 Tax=Paenibacillus pini JCM 16418 TaxID=1236976 RepID=W7Z1Z6_9BACL|nr:GyrI-like domain-containing protein [Paenibacillus pini]GAF08429.1 transcriptional regulator [Paenibacillus pini JCM 16418]
MNNTFVKRSGLELVGLGARTTNAEEAGPNGKMGSLWEAYFQRNLSSEMEFHNPHLIYCLYTDYESDASGAYTVLIGHERPSNSSVLPEELIQAVVPDAKYMMFKTKRGPVFEVVVEAWQEIWAFFETSDVERAYTGDFELYDARYFDPQDAEVQIYIAVKE